MEQSAAAAAAGPHTQRRLLPKRFRHLGTLRVVAAASVALLISGGCPCLATAAVPSPLDPTSEEPWNVLAVGGPDKKPSALETLARSATAAAQLSAAASSEATALSNEISATSSAEAAEDVAKGAESISSVASRASRSLRDARMAEQGALSQSLNIEQQLAASIARNKLYVQNLGIVAQEALTKSGLEAELVPLYKGMQEWKMAMLHPPAQEGRFEAVKAARPYEDALAKIEQDVGKYHQKAESLSREASDMRIAAAKMADMAVKKQAAGDLMGARDDMMRAHQMTTHAGMIDEDARTIQKAAEEKNQLVPLYSVAVQNAAHEAMRRFDPEHVAPVPMGRGKFLWPPPVGIVR